MLHCAVVCKRLHAIHRPHDRDAPHHARFNACNLESTVARGNSHDPASRFYEALGSIAERVPTHLSCPRGSALAKEQACTVRRPTYSSSTLEETYGAEIPMPLLFSSKTAVTLSGLIHVCEFVHLVPGLPALSSGKPRKQLVASLAMFKLLIVMLSILVATAFAELPSKKYLNLAAIKTMVAAAEAEAQKLHVEVTLCVVDESGNLLFLQKADAASLNTIQFAQRKARHAAFYRSPSKDGADALKKGNVDVLAFPDFFPNQGGLPIQVDGQTVGAIAASGAKSEIDEAIAQAAIDALLKK